MSRRTSMQIVRARDGDACALCGADPATKPTLDHIIPQARGGTWNTINLRIACQECNVRRGDTADPRETEIRARLDAEAERIKATALKSMKEQGT